MDPTEDASWCDLNEECIFESNSMDLEEVLEEVEDLEIRLKEQILIYIRDKMKGDRGETLVSCCRRFIDSIIDIPVSLRPKESSWPKLFFAFTCPSRLIGLWIQDCWLL